MPGIEDLDMLFLYWLFELALEIPYLPWNLKMTGKSPALKYISGIKNSTPRKMRYMNSKCITESPLNRFCQLEPPATIN